MYTRNNSARYLHFKSQPTKRLPIYTNHPRGDSKPLERLTLNLFFLFFLTQTNFLERLVNPTVLFYIHIRNSQLLCSLTLFFTPLECTGLRELGVGRTFSTALLSLTMPCSKCFHLIAAYVISEFPLCADQWPDCRTSIRRLRSAKSAVGRTPCKFLFCKQ